MSEAVDKPGFEPIDIMRNPTTFCSVGATGQKIVRTSTLVRISAGTEYRACRTPSGRICMRRHEGD